MRETYQADITPRDLEKTLTEYLCTPAHNFGFQNSSLDALCPSDRTELMRRDRREITMCAPLTDAEQWRSEPDYLLYVHPAGNVVYVRSDPYAPRIPSAVPFDIHLMTPAAAGFRYDQYLSLAIKWNNLSLLEEALYRRGFTLVSSLADMGEETGKSIFMRIPKEVINVDNTELPVHVFHSLYMSVQRRADELREEAGRKKAIETLSTAIGSAIIAAKVFSEKQIEYYRATADLNVDDPIFIESAII